MKRQVFLATTLGMAAAQGADPVTFDAVSVTATKIERSTAEVPQSIAVIDNQTLEDRALMNITEAIETVPGVLAVQKNGGYDTRLIIRGAGLKARYGVREIMVMRDGVPMTDPDSFTRFDFIDVQDVERVEVSKGPGSIYNANTTGGVVQIISKSVFDDRADRIRIGGGEYGTFNGNVRIGGALGDNDFVSATVSHRRSDNYWREWNKFETTQANIKYGHIFEDESTIETEISYAQADLQLPGSIDKEEYEHFKETGEVKRDSETWQHSGRYSKIWFFNSRYEKTFGDFEFKPRIYANAWEHLHPVTGMINDSKENYVIGADLELVYNHTIAGNEASLVTGVTGRNTITNNAEKHTYRDVLTFDPPYIPGVQNQIKRTLSDEKGELAGVEDADSLLMGVYALESFEPVSGLLVDIGGRYDRLNMKVRGDERLKYDYGAKEYVPGEGVYDLSESYDLFSPKFGVSYQIYPQGRLYGSFAQGAQAPTDNEIRANRSAGYDTHLDPATSTNYELGLKHRSQSISFDLALYHTLVENEIVSVMLQDTTAYRNAGKTRKQGAEFSGAYASDIGLELGAGVSLNDYKYIDYVESGKDYSGNKLKFIPDYHYTLFARYGKKTGFKAGVQTQTWGPYFMDDANTEKHGGFDFVTDVMAGYTAGAHTLQVNVSNVFDKRYAVQAQKSVYAYDYTPAAPRLAMVSYNFQF